LADPVAPSWPATAALGVLFAAVTYNLPLAVINTYAFATGRSVLIAVETLIMAAGLLVVALNWRADMTRWAFMIAVFLAVGLMLAIPRGGFDPKSFRDMLMFATFIMLGQLVPLERLRRWLVGMQALILLVMLFEVLRPETYAALVNTKSYFMNSRGFTAEQLQGDLDLFGAIRADERYFLPFLGWNRASSLFLEPLSLGAYAAFAALAMQLFWRDWSNGVRAFMLVSTGLILVGSDSRFAGATIVALLLLAPLLRRMPVMLSALFLPAAIIGARIVSQLLGWNPLEDNFTGRIARGMKQLFLLDGKDLLGFAVPTPALADSGIAYLVMAQSLLGVVMLQLFLYMQPHVRDPRARLALNGTALSFTLAILISISMLSIKTAGFYWLLVGSFLAVGGAAVAAPQRRQMMGAT
jgi:putative polymerase